MKKVGITQRVILNKNNSRIDSLEQDYIKYYSSFDINLIPIPNTIVDLPVYLKDTGIEMIILSGGGDIGPRFSKNTSKIEIFDQIERDNIEAELLKYAIKNKIPVLGECRGCEFINLFFGGSLLSDIKENLSGVLDHVGNSHEIKIIDNEFKSLFLADSINVNSFHGDGFTIKELSSQFKPFAMAPDGIVEGFYHSEMPIIGIMWHPERMDGDRQMNDNLIRYLLNKIQ